MPTAHGFTRWNNPPEAFIDHFHTCFRLKNQFKLNRRLQSQEVGSCDQKGDEYYGRELFDEKDDSKSFAIEPCKQIVRLEIYNIAEAITLGVLLRDDIPGAFELSPRAGNSSGAGFSIRRGYFVTRIYRGGMRHKLRFLGRPQAQLFYALTNRRLMMESKDSDFLSDYLRVHVGAAPSWVALPKRNPNEPRLLRAGTGHEGGYAYLEVGFANVTLRAIERTRGSCAERIGTPNPAPVAIQPASKKFPPRR